MKILLPHPARLIVNVIILLGLAVHTAHAAPIWIERQFVPEVELKDARFEVRDATSTQVVDHTPWGTLLAKHLVQSEDGVNRVAYNAFTDEEHASLKSYIIALEAIDVASIAPDVQLAFWINLYNAATVDLIIDNYPVSSIRDIEDPWDSVVATVNGVALTLNEIEHGIIRPVFGDARIHYAVNCASIGCPNLSPEPFTGATLNQMLDAAATSYVNHPRGVRIEDDDLVGSKIYGWYREDFGKNRREVIGHLRQYASPALNAQLETFRKIDDYEYDWDLNDAAGDEAPTQ